MPSAGRIALAAVLVAGTGAGATDVVRPASYRLPPLLAQLFAAGRTQFEAVETPASGLGPVFNGRSCAECHTSPAIGGGGVQWYSELALALVPVAGIRLFFRH